MGDNPAIPTREQLNNPYVLEIEADHFQCCEGCGQAFDRRNLQHVLYHAMRGHLPLRRN